MPFLSALGIDDCVAELQLVSRELHVDLEQWSGVIAARQYRSLVGAIRQFGRPGAEVLDWGSGRGCFAYWLVRNGYCISATDLQKPAIEDAIRHVSPRFTFVRLPDATRIPFADESFDLVTSVGVLEHVRETGGDEVSAIEEIRRVLRPGGHIVCVALPNRWSWVEFLARNVFSERFAHEHRYRPTDIETLVTHAALDLVTIQQRGAFPRNMTNRLPARLRDSRVVADAFDLLDRAMSVVFRPFVQNIEFVAVKR